MSFLGVAVGSLQLLEVTQVVVQAHCFLRAAGVPLVPCVLFN